MDTLTSVVAGIVVVLILLIVTAPLWFGAMLTATTFSLSSRKNAEAVAKRTEEDEMLRRAELLRARRELAAEDATGAASSSE